MKNNYEKKGFSGRKSFLKALTFLMAFWLGVQAQGYGSVFIRFDKITLEQAFRKIEKETDYSVVFIHEDIQLKKMISYEFKDQRIEGVLKTMLKGTGLDFEIKKDLILIKRKKAVKESVKSDDSINTRNAQDNKLTVSGKVTDKDGEGLPGVNILIKGTVKGVITDYEGRYSLEVSKSDVLVFSFIGYVSEEVQVNNRSTIDISLAEDLTKLEEVVVVGYGTQKRERVTTAVSSVKSDAFTQGAVNDAGSLIQGKVAGLSITRPDGNPTSNTQINLRGISTINSGTGPLVLIDGIPGDLNTVAAEDIESLDVLKDGSAAAIYGTRGSNGVILITTKSAKTGTPTTVELNAYATTQKLINNVEFLSADEYRELVKAGKPGATDYGSDVDWLDEVTRTPVSQVYNLSVKGGNDKTTYIANVNYRMQEGVIKKSDNEKMFGRVEVSHRMLDNKLKADFSLSGYSQDYYGYNNNVYRNGLTYNPTDPLKDANGKWSEHPGITAYQNPVALLEETEADNNVINLRGFGALTYTPIEALTFKALASNNIKKHNEGYYESKKHYSTARSNRNGLARRSFSRNEDNLFELTGLYNGEWAEHTFSFLGGYSYRKNTSERFSARNYNFPADETTYNNLGGGRALKDGAASMSSNKTESVLVGYFARVNYAYKDKYLLMASVRHEGSTKFGDNYKWGSFPAVSLGWNLHKESFLEDSKVLSSLKLRGGYGVTGIEPDEAYMSLALLNFKRSYYYDGNWGFAVSPATNVNPDLRWEKKKETNIGIDFGLFDNRLFGTLDLYNRRTTDLIMNYPVPTPPYLYDNIFANAAVMDNKGLELSVNYLAVKKKDLEWTTGINFSTNRNELVSLSDESFRIEGGFIDLGSAGEPIQQRLQRIAIGEPIGNFYGYKSIDIDDQGYWIIEGADGEPKSIKDQQPEDKQVLGNGLPDFNLNWNNTVRYKNWDFSVLMRGAFGFQILNQNRMWYEAPVMLTRGNILKSSSDKIYGKRVLADDQELQYVSYYLEDGDYWKIDNVTVGYTFDLKNSKIKNARVYFSALNLYTFTGYNGNDPEVSTSYNGNPLVPGVDNKHRYPSTRSFTVGFSASF
ncbi:SusC/RagA family TonB-linked outer membrane protein (plasmid) [Fulvitalea axinellae]|uniref:SusC/RagA family TonB-linked outer membrane protein n=1 Tax=Fulvitalea axinellae TaxID=1182444 RepID=A0AAU9CS94_9BACT|nr:SusC/RagA family TonB-linked outer membrane protein [Fulvitalea axinellae]